MVVSVFKAMNLHQEHHTVTRWVQGVSRYSCDVMTYGLHCCNIDIYVLCLQGMIFNSFFIIIIIL